MRKNQVTIDLPPDMSIFSQAKVDYVFVYGTLKRGFSRNSMLGRCRYVGQDTLIGWMFDLGAFPAYIPDEGGGSVEGEVYELPENGRKDILASLDAIEGLPYLYYRYAFRTLTGKVAWAYFFPRDRIMDEWALIVDGEWNGRGENLIQRWSSYLIGHEAGFPKKMISFYDSVSKCMTCDYFVAGDKGRPYASLKMDEVEDVDAVIPFGIPRAPLNVGKEPRSVILHPQGDLKTDMSRLWPDTKKEDHPEDSTAVVQMVEVVWLHSKDEAPEKAGPQEVGGI